MAKVLGHGPDEADWVNPDKPWSGPDAPAEKGKPVRKTTQTAEKPEVKPTAKKSKKRKR